MTGLGASSPLSHDQASVIDCARQTVNLGSKPSYKFHPPCGLLFCHLWVHFRRRYVNRALSITAGTASFGVIALIADILS